MILNKNCVSVDSIHVAQKMVQYGKGAYVSILMNIRFHNKQ